MNVTAGLTPKAIKGFKGLWSRGSDENVPEDHLSLCENCIFPGQNLIGIREPLVVLETLAGLGAGEYVISTFGYSIIVTGTNATDFLYLTSAGKLIDGASGTVLGTFTGGFANPDDMSCVNYGGRVFISLKAQGIAWENASASDSSIHYYDGTNFATIAGVGPTGAAPTLAQVNPGTVDAGVHTVAVAYLYRYGYISPPGTSANITSLGGKDIEVSGIPVSADPAVIGRVLIMTKADETEFFFVKTINNNVATTAVIDVTDAELLDSADYLNDLLTIVPNGAALKVYHGRLVVVGPHGVENNTLFSNQLSPESFDVTTGAVQLPADFQAMDPNTGVIINDTFYILKPNGTFSTQDNGGNPNTWNVTAIDAGLGGWDTGVSAFGSNSTDILDNCLICSPRGLIMFTGSYQDTPLSFKIERLWNSINPKLFYLVQICHDVWNKRVYIAAPGYGSAYNNFLLMMDYSEGLGPTSVKWSTWVFAAHAKIPKLMSGVYLITGSGAGNIAQQPIFVFGDSNKIHTLPNIASLSTHLDEGTDGINQEIHTAPIILEDQGTVNLFLLLRLNIDFNQNLILQAFNADRSINYSIRGFSNVPHILSWAAYTTFLQGQYMLSGGHYYKVINGGTSGPTLPALSTTGGTTSDGPVNAANPILWLDTGTVAPAAPYYAGQELERAINFTTEQLIIKISNDYTQSASWFTLSRLDVYGKTMWQVRPALMQNS